MKNRLFKLSSRVLAHLEHEAQLFHYLRATDKKLGLLLNFGRRADFRRIVM